MTLEQDLVDRLFDRHGLPVTLADRFGALLAHSSHPPELLDPLRANSLMTRTAPQPDIHQLTDRARRANTPHHVRFADPSSRTRFVVPLWLSGEAQGFLYFLDTHEVLSPADMVPFARDFTLVAEHIRAATDELDLRSAILAHLLAPDEPTRNSAVTTLESTAAFGQGGPFSMALAPADALGEHTRTALRGAVGRDALISNYDSRFVLALTRTPATVLAESLRTRFPSSPATRIGISDTFDDLRDATAHRRECVLAQRAPSPVHSGVISWTDLSTSWRMLLSLTRSDALKSISPPVTRFLTEADANDRELARLLAEGNASIIGISTLMHLHRGTIYYRIRRIQELYGLDLQDEHARIDLALGLRAWQLHNQPKDLIPAL